MKGRTALISAIVCVFVAMGTAGCGMVESPAPSPGDEDIEKRRQEANNPDTIEEQGCQWKCEPCRPGEICTQVCEPVGVCEARCDTLKTCGKRARWNPKTCECEAVGGREKCGNVICKKGQVCCNESCGICTDPDQACIQQYCF